MLVECADFLTEDPSTPGLPWLEFHSPEGTKAKAIQRLISGLNVDRLVVFGDGPNDLPMFEIANESYAVANAIPALKAIATGVIGSNDQDAVAHWIDTFRFNISCTAAVITAIHYEETVTERDCGRADYCTMPP